MQVGPTYWGKYTPFTVSAYLVDGLLIDGGCYKNREQIIMTCGNQVNQVVITHYHLDHCGTGHYFAKQGIPVYAHSEGVPRLGGAQTHPMHQKVIWGKPPAFTARSAPTSLATHKNHCQLIYTPGHSIDHLSVYFEKEGWLFSGDLFLNERVKFIGKEENYYHSLASLRQLQKLDISRIFCGMGRVVKQPQKAIQEKIDFMEQTIERVWDLHHRGLSTKAITKQVLGSDLKFLFTTGDFCKKNLVRSVLTSPQE